MRFRSGTALCLRLAPGKTKRPPHGISPCSPHPSPHACLPPPLPPAAGGGVLPAATAVGCARQQSGRTAATGLEPGMRVGNPGPPGLLPLHSLRSDFSSSGPSSGGEERSSPLSAEFPASPGSALKRRGGNGAGEFWGLPRPVWGCSMGLRVRHIWIQNHWLYDLGHGPNPFWISISSSLKWSAHHLVGLL